MVNLARIQLRPKPAGIAEKYIGAIASDRHDHALRRYLLAMASASLEFPFELTPQLRAEKKTRRQNGMEVGYAEKNRDRLGDLPSRANRDGY